MCTDSARMNTFPILAAADPAPLPSPSNSSHGAPGDNTDFSQVLRRLDSTANASPRSGTAGVPPRLFSLSDSSADTASANDRSAILPKVSAPPSSPSTTPDATTAEEGALRFNGAPVSCAKNAESELACGVLLHARDKVKEAAAKQPPSGGKTRSCSTATAAVVSAIAVPVPAKASPLAAVPASAESAVADTQGRGEQSAKALLDRLSGFVFESGGSPGDTAAHATASILPGTAVPASHVSPASTQSATAPSADSSACTDETSLTADRAALSASASALAAEVRASTVFRAAQPTLPTLGLETAPRAPSSAIAAADEVKARAKTAVSPGKAGGTDVSAGSNEAAPGLRVSTDAASLPASPVREDFVPGSTQFDHATFRSGADSPSRETKNRSRSAVVPQSNSASGAPEKSAFGEHDASASLAPEGSARTISFQPASFPPPIAPALATLDTAQSAAQSIAHPGAVVLPQPSRDTAGGDAQPQPQLPPSALPDPHRMVDSGQLRMSESNSELKVSVQLPELGKIEVRAVTSHDVTTAHLTASHGDALRVLSADRTGLEQALKSRDVILGSLDSQTQRHSGGQQRQENAPSSAPPSAGTSSTAARAATSATEETARVGFLPDYSSISVRA